MRSLSLSGWLVGWWAPPLTPRPRTVSAAAATAARHQIMASKSVAGLSPSAFYSETVAYIVNAVYHVARGNPFR